MLLEGSGDLLDFAHALLDAFEAPPGARTKQRQALDAEHVVALGEVSPMRPSYRRPFAGCGLPKWGVRD